MAERDIKVDKTSIEIAREAKEEKGSRKEEPANAPELPELKGHVTRKKTSGIKKVVSAFAGEEVDNVGQYILYDVVIPGVKDLLYNVIIGGAGMALFGESRPRNRPSGNGSHISRYGSASYVSYDRPERRTYSANRRAVHDFDDILMDTRDDAEEVLDYLLDLVDKYGQATVYDLYDAVGVTANYTDRGFGWRALGSARVMRVRDGYRIDLPPAQPL